MFDEEKREDGYVELDKLFCMPDTKILSWNEDIYDFDKLNIFSYQGVMWFYKKCIHTETGPYYELIAEELAKDFKIPVAHYDLAIYKNQRGVISKNFKKENHTYIAGIKLLREYAAKISSSHLEKRIWGHNYNSLEGVFETLEDYYQDHPKKREVVSKLMNQFVDLFLFDMITGQGDRHFNNWMIEEAEVDINLVPLFDNELILSDNQTVEFPTFVNSDCSGLAQPIYNVLGQFLTYSEHSAWYQAYILDKLNLIEEEHLNQIFSRIEERTYAPVPDNIKEKVLRLFRVHRKMLLKEIEKFQENSVSRKK